MQDEKCPVTGDSKHDYLFHKRRTSALSNKEPEYKEKNLTSRKLKNKQVENLIKITLNPILQVSSVTTQ